MPAKTAEEVDALFEKGINAGDVESVVALYEPNGVLIPAPGEPATGTDAIRAAITSLVSLKPQLKLVVTNVVTAGDVAAVYNDWSGTITGPDGSQTEISGKAIEICRRQPDGTWLFVIDDPYARG
jgi:uncharacterized protein (TIGR02246 family)